MDGDWMNSIAKIFEEMQEAEMSKIAVASEKEMVSEHFGYCLNFNIFEIDDNQIRTEESIINPGHKPGFLPVFLNERGVDVVISGGMGNGAVTLFNEKGIEVVIGAKGEAKAAAEAYLRGELESTGSICQGHQHENQCGR